MKILGLILVFFLSIFSFCCSSDSFSSVFYNLKYDKTNVRFGPSESSPLKFFLKCQKLPVKVLKVHEDWYFIHDFEGESGWIHKRMVSQMGFVLVIKKSFLKKDKKSSSLALADLSKSVLVKLKKCHNNLCYVEIKGDKKVIAGWVPEKNLWGINFKER